MGTTAIYAGSFDPPTLGHLDIVRRASGMFERVLIGIGHNPAKRYLIDLDVRRRLLRECTLSLGNVEVISFDGLLVDTCRREGASVIVRGLRSSADFDTESRYALANRDLTGVETAFLISSPELSFISSSLVKEIASNGGDVSRYVPANVLDVLLGSLP